MIRSFLTVSSGTLASRLLGFVRDSLVAALLGAGADRGCVPGGLSIGQRVRRLMSEGGLNAALVPAWLRVRETGGALQRRPLSPAACSATITAALIVRRLLLGAADAVRDHGAGAGVFRPRDACSLPSTMPA